MHRLGYVEDDDDDDNDDYCAVCAAPLATRARTFDVLLCVLACMLKLYARTLVPRSLHTANAVIKAKYVCVFCMRVHEWRFA